MKLLLLIITLLSGINIFAQKENLKCEAISNHYRLELFKITSNNQFKNYRPVLPFYMIDSLNYQVIKTTLQLMTSRKNEILELKENLNSYRNLANEHDTVLLLQEKRVELYQKSYNQLIETNKQLSSQFDKVYDLSLKEARKSKLNNFMYGILAGMVAGITIGVVIK